MARPRTVSEEGVLRAAGNLLREGGPSALTFAAVGARAGLAPATLVQRYGRKEALLQAALLLLWDDLDAATAALDAGHPADPEGAVALLVDLSAGHGEDEDMGLLLLREDFRDPLLRARGTAWGEALARALGRRLTADPAAETTLGRLMASQWQGALTWWGFSRSGPLDLYIRRELGEWCRIVLRPR